MWWSRVTATTLMLIIFLLLHVLKCFIPLILQLIKLHLKNISSGEKMSYILTSITFFFFFSILRSQFKTLFFKRREKKSQVRKLWTNHVNKAVRMNHESKTSQRKWNKLTRVTEIKLETDMLVMVRVIISRPDWDQDKSFKKKKSHERCKLLHSIEAGQMLRCWGWA